MRKRITAVLLSLCMLFCAAPVMAGAAEGDSRADTWDVSESGDGSLEAYYENIAEFDNRLCISGKGKMKDYLDTRSPWEDDGMDAYIVEVKIENGVTNIGSRAFYTCKKVSNISLPESVKTIKGNSFPANCAINCVASDNNHEFQGWYESADYSGTAVAPASFSPDKTYYAKWGSKAEETPTPEPVDPTPDPDTGKTDDPDTGDNDDEPNTDDPEQKPEPTPPEKQKYDTTNLKFEDATATYDGKAHSLQATGVPDGVTVTYDGNNQVAAGTYTVTAKFTGDSEYEPIPNQEAKLTIEKAEQDISFGYETKKVLAEDKPFTNPLIGVKERAAVTYASSDSKVAEIDKDGTITIKGLGTATITAKTAETLNYKSAEVKFTLTVVESLDETEEKEEETLLTTEYPNGVTVSVPKEQGKVKSAVVTVPKKVTRAVVTIPLESVTTGTVAMNAKTGEILKLCAPDSDGLAVEVSETISLILFDNSKLFSDIKGHWAEQDINFASAHDMFAGTSETTFEPNITMTRAMMMTMLARFNGVEVNGGATWYERSMNWAKAVGVSDGTQPMANITREQLVTMLYRYSDSPKTTQKLSAYSDAGKVSSWAEDAIKWAVQNDIIRGMDKNTLQPRGQATRAQTAAIMTRYCTYLLAE